MDDIAPYAATLAGVVIGVLGSLLTTMVTDTTSWRREQRTRFDQRHLEVCIEFAAASRALGTLQAAATANNRPDETLPPFGDGDPRAQLMAAEERLILAWEALCLLTDDATIKAGRATFHWLRRRMQILLADTMDQSEWDLASAKLRDSRDAFVAAVRQKMAVPQLSTTSSSSMVYAGESSESVFGSVDTNPPLNDGNSTDRA